MTIRRSAVALVCAVAASTAGTVATTPAAAAPTPIPLHDREAAQPVYDLDSDPAGTVFVTTGGEVRLVRAPMTPASDEVSLGKRGHGYAPYPGQEVSIQSGRVAIPMLPKPVTLHPAFPAFATTVRWCLVADCPATSTLTVPAGYRYIGNAGDVAVVHKPDTNTLGLLPWAGGAMKTVSLGVSRSPWGAYGDATGIVLWHPERVKYVARPSLAVTTYTGQLGYLTPSYIVYVSLNRSTYPYTYAVNRVPRATPAAPPTATTVPVSSPSAGPTRLVATDTAAAWTTPPPSPHGTPDQVESLKTLRFGGQPSDAGLAEWQAFAPFEDSDAFLVHRDAVQGRAFYAVDPQTTAPVRVHALPPVTARARSIWVADDRVAYTDDATIGGRAYYRDVTNGVPGPESVIRDIADTVSISAPFAAVAKHPIGDTALPGPGYEDGVYAGRLGGALSEQYIDGDPVLSGHRVVAQAANRVERTSLLGGDGYERASVTGTVSGELYYVADRNGAIQRRDLRSGTVVTIRPASCSGCGTDQSRWQLWGWGDDLLYALDLGAQGRATGLWKGATGTTTPLPMLAAGWTRLSYRDGLLLAHHEGDGVRLYDLGAGTSALVDAQGDLPYGNGLGNEILAWRDAQGRAVVAPIADFVAGFDPEPRYLNSAIPPGLVTDPGKSTATWNAEWYLTDDTSWQLQFRQGDASGPVVRTMSGTTSDETIAPRWNGTDDDGAELPHGWYAWTLTSDAVTQSGRVFLSRELPPTPTLTVPRLTSDVSASDRFTIRWDGAPEGYHYELHGPDGTLHTTAESRTYFGRGPGTYRWLLFIVDPAGRRGPEARGITVTPFDDRTGKPSAPAQWTRSYASQHWLGSQLRSATPGAKLSFAVTGEGIWVVGAKGPTYGRYRVTVDGRSWIYDAYSPVVRFRQVLFQLGGLADVRHQVTVEVLATAGRTRVGVDAIGARRSEDMGR